MIYVKNLKTDSENDNEKAGVPSFPPPKRTTSYIDDLDFFNDFENEFPAIVYNNAQTSKSDLLTEPILSPQHIDEFNLNDETSVSEYNEEEQNTLYFNDIFPFNIIRPDELKSEKDNNDNDIDIIQSSEGNEITHRSNMLMDSSSDKIDKIFNKESFVLELNVNIVTWIYLFNGMLLCFIMNLYVPFGIPFDPKRYYKDGDYAIMLRRPRYQGLEYTDVDIDDFKTRLTRIYKREVHRVHVFDFRGLPNLMAEGLSGRMLMEYRDNQGAAGFGAYWADSARQILDKGDLKDYWIRISYAGDFLSTTLSYYTIRDPILRLCHRLIACSIVGRSQAPKKVIMTDLFSLRGMNFMARLAKHFGLLTIEILGGLTVIAFELPIIDMAELVRLQIYVEIDDTWAWVALGPERQPDAVAGAPGVAQDAPIVDEGGQADPAPALTDQREVIDAMAPDFSRFSTWAITGLARMMDRAGVSYVPYSETHVPYQRRRVRQRTGKASTSAAQQDPQQPDP
ncbi:hypothetical protein Tco_0295791 [Tanacetum coccineum]